MRRYAENVLACCVAMLPATMSQAAITTTGFNATLTNSRGEVQYRVASNRNSTLTIDDGSTFAHDFAYVGFTRNHTGTVTIRDPGSKWSVDQYMYVGWEFSNGEMYLQNGGTLEVGTSYIVGTGTGGAGFTRVETGGVVDAGWITVSSQAPASMEVLSGGKLLTSNGGLIGGNRPWNNTTSGGELLLDGPGSEWINAAGWVVVGGQTSGTLTIRNGARVTNHQRMVVAQQSGSTGVLNLEGGVLDLQGYPLDFGSGDASFNFLGGQLLNVASVDFDLVQQGGLLAAGASPGVMQFAADYTLQEGATIEVELAGSGGAAGVDFDFYNIAGDAMLEGVMQVSAYNGFEPVAGSTYDVVTATTIDFASLTLASDTLPFVASVVPGGNGQILRLTTVPEPATATLLLLMWAAASSLLPCRSFLPKSTASQAS